MGLHYDLDIYRETRDLLKKVMEVVRNIRRDVKQLFGMRLMGECLTISVLIYRANVSRDPLKRVQHIHDLRESLQVVELMLRTSVDMEWIPRTQYAALIAMTQSIGKQSTGWLKQSANAPAR